MARITLSDGEAQFDCGEGDTILRAALRSGIGMSYSCNVGSCGNCRFELLEGSVSHVRADPPAWSERDRQKNRWLGCQALPAGDCRIKFRQDPGAVPAIRPSRRGGRLMVRRDLGPDLALFSFAVEGDGRFLPGQYALLSLPGLTGGRVYSMSNKPGGEIWEFLVKRVPGGAATSVLFGALDIGDSVGIDGPYGLAFLREDAPRDLVLISGGSGLSPMLSIARSALGSSRQEVHLFHGGRGPADLVARTLLSDLDPSRLSVMEAVSDPAQAVGWAGPTGFVHDVAVAAMGDRLAACEVYFAGPPAMSAATQSALRAAGVPPAQIHFDEFY